MSPPSGRRRSDAIVAARVPVRRPRRRSRTGDPSTRCPCPLLPPVLLTFQNYQVISMIEIEIEIEIGIGLSWIEVGIEIKIEIEMKIEIGLR